VTLARARATPIDGIEPEGFRYRRLCPGAGRFARGEPPIDYRAQTGFDFYGGRGKGGRQGGREGERVNARRSPPHVYPRALAIIVADR
jgi:hypothetical protein